MTKSNRRFILAIQIVASATLMWVLPADACGPGKAFLDEGLTSRPEWVIESTNFSYTYEGLTITETSKNTGWFLFYDSQRFSDHETCVTVSAKAGGKGDVAAGLAFFFQDSKNYVSVLINNTFGAFRVSHSIDNVWHNLIAWSFDTVINKGPDAENYISVVTSGNHATVLINGQKVAQLSPAVRYIQGGTYVGLLRTGGEFEGSAIFRYRDLQVREVTVLPR